MAQIDSSSAPTTPCPPASHIRWKKSKRSASTPPTKAKFSERPHANCYGSDDYRSRGLRWYTDWERGQINGEQAANARRLPGPGLHAVRRGTYLHAPAG